MIVLTRRRFLGHSARVLAAAAAWADGFPLDVLRAGAGRVHAAPLQTRPRFDRSPFTLGVASGDPTDDGVVLWTRLAPDPLAPGGGMPDEAVRVVWEVAEDEHFARIVARANSRGVSAARARRPRRGGRAPPGAAVLVSLPRRHVGEPGRADADRARAVRRRRSRAPRLRVLPALGARLLHGASAPRARRPRRRALPRRLHLRVRRLRESGAAGDRPRGRHARRLPAALRAVQDRSRPPGGARRVPVHRHLGRSRGRQRLRQRPCRRTATRASRSCAAAPRPTRPTSSTCRCAPSAGRGARTCRSTGRSPTAGCSTSASSTRASTGRRSPAAAARARSATAPAPPARPSSASASANGCSITSPRRRPAGTCWRSR